MEIVYEDENVKMEAHPLPIVTPLADDYADFVVRECATAGMIHAAMAAMSPIVDIGALSPDECEMVEKARGLLLQIHAGVLARADYRKKTLAWMREVMVAGDGLDNPKLNCNFDSTNPGGET